MKKLLGLPLMVEMMIFQMRKTMVDEGHRYWRLHEGLQEMTKPMVEAFVELRLLLLADNIILKEKLPIQDSQPQKLLVRMELHLHFCKDFAKQNSCLFLQVILIQPKLFFSI